MRSPFILQKLKADILQTAGIILVIACFLIPVRQAQAQFIYFSMEVEPELSATTLEDLDFGTIPVESGRSSIGLGEAGMGVFMLRGLQYQRLTFELEVPEELNHELPGIDATIPIDLNFAYNNRGTNNSNTATIVDGLDATLTLLGDDFQAGQPISEYLQSNWAQMYIYVYGSIEIGNVPSGVYKNQVTVRVEY